MEHRHLLRPINRSASLNLATVAARCLGAAATVLTAALMFAACIGTSAGGEHARPTPYAWHLAALGIRSTPPSTLGRGELIAVLDTGLDDARLPALAGRVFSRWDQLRQVPTALDDNGHGTEMAVIIAGGGDRGVWGLAPSANVMPIKVADRDGQASPDAIASGIARAVAMHASVINISLATQVPDPGIGRAIAAAIAAGSIVVAAAGDAHETGAEFPASEPGVVAVYAQDRSGLAVDRFNQPVGSAAMAPGVDIATLVPTSRGVEEKLISGTSAAAAIMAGLLADCLSVLEAGGTHTGVAAAICKSRVVRQSDVPGFLEFRLVTAGQA